MGNPTIFPSSTAARSPTWHSSRSHNATYAGMLQLTQTENGRLTGVVSEVTLKPDGKITAEQGPLSLVIDSGQLTLSLRLGLFESNVAGTVSGNTIHLQGVGEKGDVLAWTYTRGTAAEFQTYADQFKSKSQAITFSASLEKSSKDMDATVREAEAWMSEAEAHLRRIPGVKEYYRKISAKMDGLLQQQRTTRNFVGRTQINVAIIQGVNAGLQTDIKVNGLWDRLEGQGAALHRKFASYPANCGSPEELGARGASASAVASWQSSCPAALAEKAKFADVLPRFTDARADLKAFQKAEERRREQIENQSTEAL